MIIITAPYFQVCNESTYHRAHSLSFDLKSRKHFRSFFIIVGLEHWQHKQAFSISASFLSNKRLPMLLPKLFTTHHTDLLPCFKMFSNFYSFTISCTYVVVKCLCPAARHAGNELQTTLSPSPLLGYFIGPLNSCDSSSRDRVWLVFTTSSANFDT